MLWAGCPGGLPLVAYELSAHCTRLDLSTSAAGGAPPTETHNEWRRLRRLLDRHDCAAYDYELSTAAARGALYVEPSMPLPRWLIEHINPPPVGAPISGKADGAPWWRVGKCCAQPLAAQAH